MNPYEPPQTSTVTKLADQASETSSKFRIRQKLAYAAGASFLIFVLTSIIKWNSTFKINGHLEVKFFGRTAGPFMSWFLFGNSWWHQSPLELIFIGSMILPLMWLVMLPFRNILM